MWLAEFRVLYTFSNQNVIDSNQPTKKKNQAEFKIQISSSMFDLIKENAFSCSIYINEKFRLWYNKYILCKQILKILEKKNHAVLEKNR